MIHNIDEIKRRIISIVESLGIEVVEEKISTAKGILNVRLRVDFPEGGIDITTCANVNRRIVDYLESQGELVPDYTVDVASPGLDRKLKTLRDFQKVRGNSVEVLLKEKVNKKGQWKGRLAEVSEDGISLEINRGKGSTWLFIPYDNIQQGRVLL